MTQHNTE